MDSYITCLKLKPRNLQTKMFKKMRLSGVLLFVVFTMVKCSQEDEVTTAPISKVENTKKEDSLVLQRIKRQLFRPGFPLARAQSRAPTVIVVPERGSANIPAYDNVPISQYSVNSPNRGTTVVVSQVPDYNYNGIGRSYDILPVNPIRI